ncbi:ComF family protein [bacterium]|nr:MAG: ComF family protein [bacterium]
MWRKFLAGLADIIYPKTCIGCKSKLQSPGAINDLICSSCWQKIKKNTPPFCHSCGRRLLPGNCVKNICRECLKQSLSFDRAFSPCVYDGVIKNLIHAFKYGGRVKLGKPLSSLMIEFIKEYNLPLDFIDFIIPMPLHRTRLREREFNQAQILSDCIAAEFNKKMLDTNLIRHRHTKTQTELKMDKRLANVKGSFSVLDKEAIKGANILLIDDVLTTAATCSEAASALKNNGANIVFVLTLAS